jgi:peptidyl-prolyl cis-trans isomerase D
MFDMANELDDLLVAGDTLREAAASLGLEVKTIEQVDAEGDLADPMDFQIVPSDPEFLAELFLAEPSLPTPVIETNSGGLMVIEVTDIEAERMRNLDEARDLVLADWRAGHQAETAAATARALVDGADAATALADLEELTGYRATGTETLLRTDQPQVPGTDATLVVALFKAQVGETVIAPSTDGTGQVLARLTSIDTPDPTADPDAVAPLSASVAGGNRQAITDQHLAYLRQAYDIVINQELIAQRF